MQPNNLFAEPERLMDPGNDYTGGGFLGEKVKCVALQAFWSLCLLPCIQRIKEEARANNIIGGICGLTETPHNYHVYLPSLRMIFLQRDVKFDEDKAMWCSLERDLHIPPEEELLAPK